jgi:hypothetical protein
MMPPPPPPGGPSAAASSSEEKKEEENSITEMMKNPSKVVLLRVCFTFCDCLSPPSFPSCRSFFSLIPFTTLPVRWAWVQHNDEFRLIRYMKYVLEIEFTAEENSSEYRKEVW